MFIISNEIVSPQTLVHLDSVAWTQSRLAIRETKYPPHSDQTNSLSHLCMLDFDPSQQTCPMMDLYWELFVIIPYIGTTEPHHYNSTLIPKILKFLEPNLNPERKSGKIPNPRPKILKFLEPNLKHEPITRSYNH